MQQLEHAILISFSVQGLSDDRLVKVCVLSEDFWLHNGEMSASPSTLPPVQDEAEAFLAARKLQDNHFEQCLLLFENTDKPEVQFWCLKSILEVLVSTGFGSSTGLDMAVMKATVAKWSFADHATALSAPAFVQNKIAQLLAALAAELYPDDWPTLFSDMLAAAGRDTARATMFARVLLALDEDVISLDIPRSEAGSRRSMAFKDAMRDHDVSAVVAACTRLVAAHYATSPPTARALLSALQRYVDWVDISLIVTPGFMALLRQLLQEPSQLQGAASATLSAILSKRMEAQPKLQLIQQMYVAPVAAQWEVIANSSGEWDEDVAEHLASFLNVLACETIESLKRIENQFISMKALGIDVDGGASADASASIAAGQQVLEQLMSPVLRTLLHECSGIRLACMPFLTAHLSRVRNACKRQGGVDPTVQPQLLRIMEALAVAMRYPADSCVSAAQPSSQEAAVMSEEEEAMIDEQRQELTTLLRNMAKIVPDAALSPVHQLLVSLTAEDARPRWQDVEVAVAMLYELGEALVDDVNSAGCGAFRAPVTLLMSKGVPHEEHRLVAGAVLECFVRYVRVAAGNRELVPTVMRAFLGGCGLSHAHYAHATRACYLFMRVVKVLRPSLKDYLQELIQGLIPIITAIAANPVQPSTGALKATQGKGAPGTTLQLDDRMYAWEAMSLLLASDDVPEDVQAAFVRGLLQQLCTQIRSNLEGDLSSIAVMGSSPPASSMSPGMALSSTASQVMLLNHALEAVARLSKGFSQDRMTKHRPQIGASFQDVLPVALLIPERLPRNRMLRARFISYLHRMVECLGTQLLPFLPQSMAALLPRDCDTSDVTTALRLLNQLIAKYPQGLVDTLQELVPSVVIKVHQILPDTWDWTGAAAAAQGRQGGGRTGTTLDLLESGDLQQVYFHLLQLLIANELLLRVLPQGELLSTAMSAVVKGAASHVDVSTRKTCIASLVKLVKLWGSDASFKQFAIDRVGIHCCIQGTVNGGVDIRDGGALGLLSEVATCVKALHELYGEEFMHAARTFIEADVAAASNEAVCEKWNILIQNVMDGNIKGTKDALKAMMRLKQGVVSRIPQRTS
eukprot:jgi/Ulvmu1/1820/UM119_0038.1